MKELRFIVECICLPVLVLGIAGNALALVVFCRQRRKSTTNIILQVLAVVDSLCLICIFLGQTSYYIAIRFDYLEAYKPTWKVLFRCVLPLAYIFRIIDMWLVTTLTVDRWIAVCKPLHAQQMCTVSTGYKRIAATIIFGVLFSLPRFIEEPAQYGLPIQKSFSGLSSNQFYTIIYKGVLFTIFMYILPLAATVVLNIKLLSSLKMTDPTVTTLRQHLIKDGREERNQREHRNVTVVVIIVCCVSVLCSTVAMTSQILYATELCFCQWLKSDIELYRRVTSEIGQVLMVVNCSSNIFIYSIFSKNFRSSLKVCCKRKEETSSNEPNHRRLDPTLSNDATETFYLQNLQSVNQSNSNTAERKMRLLNEKYY